MHFKHARSTSLTPHTSLGRSCPQYKILATPVLLLSVGVTAIRRRRGRTCCSAWRAPGTVRRRHVSLMSDTCTARLQQQMGWQWLAATWPRAIADCSAKRQRLIAAERPTKDILPFPSGRMPLERRILPQNTLVPLPEDLRAAANPAESAENS